MTHVRQGLQSMLGAAIDDIVVVGYTESCGSSRYRFSPLLDAVFLSVNGQWVAMHSKQSFSKLVISIVPEIYCPHEIEEEDLFTKTSLTDILLWDSVSQHSLCGFELFEETQDGSELLCSALRIRTNHQFLFLDPSHPSGIKIGESDAFRRWEENLPSDRCWASNKIE